MKKMGRKSDAIVFQRNVEKQISFAFGGESLGTFGDPLDRHGRPTNSIGVFINYVLGCDWQGIKILAVREEFIDGAKAAGYEHVAKILEKQGTKRIAATEDSGPAGA
jgi:hypothetical protein